MIHLVFDALSIYLSIYQISKAIKWFKETIPI